LLLTWLNFLDLLPPLLEKCESTEVLSEALLSWFASLEELDQMLERCLRWIIIHEYIHAKTRWIRQRVGKQTFRLLGVVRMQTDIAFQSTLPLQHRLLNEAFTEWLALRFYQQLFQSAVQLRWQDLCWGSPYPAWIIEYVAQALDSQWETLSQAFPALTQHALCCTADLVSHIFFVDPEAIQLLKDLLVHIGHQEDAFEKISHACDCSHQSGDEAPAQQQAALQDLYDLFAWTFPNEVREKLAFVVSTNVTVEDLLGFSLLEEHAGLPLSRSHGQEGI
jgi:hypothetical protein